MAHPPDQALGRAITAVLREARSRGMTGKDLAGYFGVSDATISRWEAGGRQPALDLLPAFDKLAKQPRGYVLRRAGYVTDDDAATRYDVNLDDPDERSLWELTHIAEETRWKLILELRGNKKPARGRKPSGRRARES
jgi:transcriptional regulator with XRE-family HTH domain